MLLPKTPFSKSNHFGISINENSLRIVVIDSLGKLQSQEEVLFDTPIINGDKVDKNTIINALKIALEKSKIDQKYAAISIPEKYAYSRVHTFPNVSTTEIDEAINWQLEKIFPFSKKEIYSDWKLINKDNDQITVLVTVIPKILLDNLKHALQASGVFPISFEPSASALTRLVKSEEHTQIIVELNTQSTSATLVVDNISSLTTTTTFNSQSTPQEVLRQITSSIQSLISYMGKHEMTLEKTRLILTGEKASQQLAEIISQSLKLKAEILNIENIEPRYHLAYIAANAQILPPSSEQSINLLPTSLQTYYLAQINYTLAKSVIKYVITLAIITSLIAGSVLGGIQLIIGQTNNNKLSLQNQTITENSGEFDLAKVNRKANNIVLLFNLKDSPEQTLTEILNVIPKNIILTNITVVSANKTYTLIGAAQSREDLLLLKQNIEDIKQFSKINIPLETLEIQEDINFNISFTHIGQQQ